MATRRSKLFGLFLLPCIAVATGGLGFAPPASAAPMYWSSSGTWGTSPQWSNTSGSGYTQAWIASSNAVFEGSAGTVTVSGNQSAASLQFTTDGYLLTGGSVTLTASGGSITTGPARDEIDSVLAGTVGLTTYGGGTLVLGGNNTYSGGTTLSAGTLQIGNGGVSGSYGSGTLLNNATLVWNNSSGISIGAGNAISGSGAVTILAGNAFLNGPISSGLITVAGTANTSSFEIWSPNSSTLSNNFVLNSMGSSINRGAINQDGDSNANGAVVTLSGSITLAGNSLIGVGGTSLNSMAISGPIAGPGMLFVNELNNNNGWEALSLSNSANSYSGGTSIVGGYLAISTPTVLGPGPVYATSGSAGLVINEFSGTVANNLFLGGTPSGGVPGALGSGAGTLVFHEDLNAATFSGSVTLTSNATMRFYDAGGTATFAQAIGGSGNLTFDASGTQVTHNQYLVFGGSSPSTYGNTTVLADGGNGIIRLGGGGLPTAGTLTMTDQSNRDTVLDLAGYNQTLGGLIGTVSGLGDFVMNSSSTLSTLTINNASANTFAGVIGLNTASTTGQTAGTGAIALVVSGSSTLTLGGSNTYTGGTTISSGALQLGTGAAGHDGTINATSGISNNAALVFNPYASQTVMPAISGTGTVTKLGPGITYLSGSNTYTGGTTISGGVLDIATTASLPGWITPGGFVVTAGGALAVPDAVSDANIATLLTTGNFAAGAAIGFDTSSGSRTYNPVLADTAAGALGLVKAGTSSLTLTAVNTYTGGTTICNAGSATPGSELILANTAAVQGNVMIGNGCTGVATLQMSASNQLTPNAIVTFNDNNPNWAYWKLMGNSQTIGNIQSAPGGYGVIENTETDTGFGNAVLTLNNSASSSFDGWLRNTGTGGSGTLALNLAGTGTLTLSGAWITYTGGTTIPTGGNLFLQNTSAFASPIVNKGTLTVSSTISTTAFANLNGAVSGVGPLVKTGSYGLILSTANSYTGGTTIGDGEIRINNLGGFGSGTVTVGATGCVDLWFTGTNTVANNFILNGFGSAAMGQDAIFGDGAGGGGNYTLSGSITLNANSSIAAYSSNPVTVTGPISGAGGLVRGVYRTDTGIVTLSNSGNSYAGGTTVGYGTLRQGVANAIPYGAGKGGLQVNSGAAFDLYGYAASLNGLSGTGTVSDGSSAATLTVGNSNASSAFAGVIQNAIGLIKTGSGSLTLTGVSTYTGGTSITGGTLQMGDGTTGHDGTLNWGGSITNNAALVYNVFGTQAGGNIGGSGSVQKLGAGTLLLTGNNTYTGPTIISAGTVQTYGPVANYTLNNTTADATGHLSALTLVGSAGYTTGKFGQALALTGSQYLSQSYAASLALNAYTVSVWANLSSTANGASPAIISTRTGGGDTFDLQYNDSKLHADIGAAGGGSWLSTAADYTTGALSGWNMITYAVASNGYTIYLNGGTVASGTYSGTPQFMQSGETLTVGYQATGGGYLNGSLNDLTIYNTALSASQIGALYTGQLAANFLPAGTPVQVGSGAVLDLNGSSETVASLADITAGSGGTITSSLSGALTLTLATSANTTTSYSGLLQNGGGTLSLVMSGSGTQILAGSNTYSGGTTVKGGVLDIAYPVSNLAAVNVAGGATLALGNAVPDATIATLLGEGAYNAGAALGFDTSTGNRTYGNLIADSSAGSLGLLKLGANTLTLTASNTYSGGTTVKGGVLDIAYPVSNIAAVNVAGGATLALGNAVPDAAIATLLGEGAYNAGAVLGFDTTAGNRTYNPTITDTSAGSLGLLKLGANTLTLTASNTYSGGTTVSAGALSIVSTAALPGWGTANAYKINAGGALAVGDAVTDANVATILATGNFAAGAALGFDTSAGNRTYGGAIANTGAGSLGLLEVGSGNLTLTAANTYTGGTTISGGTLQIGAGGVSGSLGTGAITDNGTLAMNLSSTLTVSSNLSGTGSLTQLGPGVLTLSNTANSYTGATNVNGGVLDIAYPLSNIAAVNVAGGATLALGNLVPDATITTLLSEGAYNGGSVLGFDTAAGNRTFNPTITDAATGPLGLLTLGANALTLTAANTYTGGTTINSGGTLVLANTAGQAIQGNLVIGNQSAGNTVLQMASANQFSPNALVTFNDTTNNWAYMRLLGYSQTIGNIQSASGGYGVIENTETQTGVGAAVLTLNNSASSSFDGYLRNTASGSGSLALNLAGTGTLTLIGGNITYSGGTTIGAGGNLFLQNTTAFASPILNNGTLTVSSTISTTAFANLNGAVSGVGPLVKTGSYGVILNASNSYTGGTTIGDGELRIGNLSGFGSGTVTVGATGCVDLWFTGTNTVANDFILNGFGSAAMGQDAIFGDGGGGGGSYTLSGSITLNANSSIAAYSSNPVTVSGPISGVGGLVRGVYRTDAGIVTLSNSGNSYAGGTTVGYGTLRQGVANAIPSGAGAGGLCVNSGAVFDLYGYNAAINALSGLGIVGNSGASTVTLNLGNGDATGTFSGTLQNGSGVVNLTKSGSGTQILNGTSSYTGVTTVNNGVLQFGTGGTLPLPATSGIAVSSVVAFNHGNSLTLSVPVTGSGALVKNGSGVLTLLGANTYQGGTTIVNGMLTSEPAGSVGSGPVTVASGGTWNLGSNTQTVAGLSGNGLITRAGVIGSPVTFSSNAASGVSTAKTYAALLDFGESTGATVNGVAFTGAALSGTTGNVTWSLAGATSTFNNNPDAPTMSDAASGGMYQLFRNFCYGGNPGVLTLTGLTPGQAYEVDLYDANYGGTRVQNMTFTQGNGYSSQVVYNEAPTTADYLPYNFIAQSSSLTIMASPQTTANTYHWYGLSVAQATAATPALTIGGANNYEFDGAITGMTSLVKQGAGTQVLTGNNTYLGGTTIAGGSLVVTGTVANSAVTVAGGATLGGAGLLGGAVTVAGGPSAANQGTINLVDNTIGTLTLSSPGTALTLGSGAGVDLEIEAGNASDCVALTAGSLALGGAVPINITPIGALSAGTYTLFTFSGGTTGSGSFVLDAIPGLGNTLKDSLSLTAGSLQLIIAPGIPANAYWQAGSGAWSTVGNWSADQGNTTQIGALPASITNLYFATAGGTATIDQAFTVNSLSLTTSNSVTVAGTGTLTLVNSAGLSDNGAAAHTINAPLALGTAQTWTINGPSALTVAGVISDAPGTNGTGLALSGGGTVVLSGANTYSGGTTIAAATTLQLGDGQSAHGSVTGNIADNGALLFDNAATTPYAGSITGSGGLTVTGSSTLTLSGTNSYGGGTTITGGGLALGGASALPSSGGLVLAGGSLDIANYAVAVSSLSLTGGTLTGSGGALTLSGAGPIDAESGTASATLAGSGGLNKTTAGTVVLGGNNSYTGGTSIEGGVLQLGGDHALPNGGNLTVDAGTLDLGGHNPTVATIGGSGLVTNSAGQGTITVNPATAATVNATIADGTGMVGVVKAGNGSLVLANGANSYSGGTTVEGGTLQLGTAGALGSIDGALTVNAGTLDLNGQNTTVGKLQSAVTTGVIASGGGPATLTAGAGDASSTFAGVIVDGVGPVSLVKTGSGTLGLAGTNSYRGGTTINGGAVSITSGGNLGDGNVTIGAATLQTSGNVVLDAARTVTLTDLASAIDTPQLSDTTTLDGPVIGTGALNKEGAGILTLAAASGDAYTGDTNVLAGILDVAADNALSPTSNLVIGDGASVVLDFGGGSGIGGNSFLGALPSPAAPSLAAPSLAAPALAPAGISTVPEPGTLVLLLVGAASSLIVWLRRSR